jgi:hypothetical protein
VRATAKSVAESSAKAWTSRLSHAEDEVKELKIQAAGMGPLRIMITLLTGIIGTLAVIFGLAGLNISRTITRVNETQSHVDAGLSKAKDLGEELARKSQAVDKTLSDAEAYYNVFAGSSAKIHESLAPLVVRQILDDVDRYLGSQHIYSYTSGEDTASLRRLDVHMSHLEMLQELFAAPPIRSAHASEEKMQDASRPILTQANALLQLLTASKAMCGLYDRSPDNEIALKESAWDDAWSLWYDLESTIERFGAGDGFDRTVLKLRSMRANNLGLLLIMRARYSDKDVETKESRLRKAERWFNEAIRHDPHCVPAYLSHGLVYSARFDMSKNDSKKQRAKQLEFAKEKYEAATRAVSGGGYSSLLSMAYNNAAYANVKKALMYLQEGEDGVSDEDMRTAEDALHEATATIERAFSVITPEPIAYTTKADAMILDTVLNDHNGEKLTEAQKLAKFDEIVGYIRTAVRKGFDGYEKYGRRRILQVAPHYRKLSLLRPDYQDELFNAMGFPAEPDAKSRQVSQPKPGPS